ncbi:MAG: PadR family transcriptional regulator [Bacteroidota bacterium]
MKGAYIGELEELVLLTAVGLNDDAYGVAIVAEIENHTGRKINIGAIHTVLRRLESKGYVTSRLGGATNERGGRRKRIYTLTTSGLTILEEIYSIRTRLYQKINPSRS